MCVCVCVCLCVLVFIYIYIYIYIYVYLFIHSFIHLYFCVRGPSGAVRDDAGGVAGGQEREALVQDQPQAGEALVRPVSNYYIYLYTHKYVDKYIDIDIDR